MLRLFLIATLLLPILGGSADAQALKVGSKAPDFRLRDRQQSLFRFSRFSAGKVVVVDFFRTDCAPCIKSLAVLKKLHHDLRANKKVRFLLIALLEDNEGGGKLDALLKRHHLPFPVVVDAYGSVAKKFIAKGNSVQLPSLFVIDKKRHVRWRHTELLRDTKAITAAINKVL